MAVAPAQATAPTLGDAVAAGAPALAELDDDHISLASDVGDGDISRALYNSGVSVHKRILVALLLQKEPKAKSVAMNVLVKELKRVVKLVDTVIDQPKLVAS